MELWGSLKTIKSTNGKSLIVRPMWFYTPGVFEKLAHVLAPKGWT